MRSAYSKRIDDSGVVDLLPEPLQPEGSVTQRYRLLSRIGAGGMGDVFLGIQKGAVDFQRLIVLKRIHSHLLRNSSHSQMFVDEASLVANLNHPHIVKIIDFRQTEDAFYIVMEYVDGETLRTIHTMCDKKHIKFPFPIACKLILSACDALQYAHNATSPTGKPLNIIHRDIGLHNLMIDRNGYLKVIDFGIAKSTIQTDLTLPEVIKGNPSYMAPDIFGYETIDNRVDIYALGLSLFELLTTTRAYRFKKNVPLAVVIQKVTQSELPPPSSIVPDIPKALDAIVKKATAKKREHRYQTVAEFAKDLQAVAQKHAAAFAAINSKDWFNKHFSERFEERIRFEKDVLSRAEATTSGGINSYVPPPRTMSNTDIVSLGQTNKTIAWHRLMKKKALVVGMASALVVSLGIGVFFALRSSDAPAAASSIVQEEDNLFISSEPPEATVIIDGKRVGNTGEFGTYFQVSSNMAHHIIIQKSGFAEHIATITVPEKSQRRIDASLRVKSTTQPVPAATASEEKEDAPAAPPAQDIAEEQTPPAAAPAPSKPTYYRRARHPKRYPSKASVPEPVSSEPKAAKAPEPPTPAPKPSVPSTAVPLLDKPKTKAVPLLDKKPKDNVPLL